MAMMETVAAAALTILIKKSLRNIRLMQVMGVFVKLQKLVCVNIVSVLMSIRRIDNEHHYSRGQIIKKTLYITPELPMKK